MMLNKHKNIYYETQTKKNKTRARKTQQHTGDMSTISVLVVELQCHVAAGSWICNGLARTAAPSVTHATLLEQHV